MTPIEPGIARNGFIPLAELRPDNFDQQYRALVECLLEKGVDVDTGHWQAMTGVPHTRTRELQYVQLIIDVPPTSGSLASMVRPNLPWAENHFQERVSGIPYNPPPSAQEWPFAQKKHEDHTKQEKFSHTYPERLWPKHAGRHKHTLMDGVRFDAGDLMDAVILLCAQPTTRQAYIPLWFPEDINAAANLKERVPCTLGYHFMMRNDKMNMFYPIRSCDLIHHWRDDVYMAGRLLQWMIAKCTEWTVLREGYEDKPISGTSPWEAVQPGKLHMFIPSLHVLEGSIPALEKEIA